MDRVSLPVMGHDITIARSHQCNCSKSDPGCMSIVYTEMQNEIDMTWLPLPNA